MALPNVPYAATTNPQMVYLDQTFAAVAALGVIPCDAAGTNAVVLTGRTNTPSLSAYANYQQFSFRAPATPTGDVTVQFTGLGTLKLFRPGQPTVQVTTGDYPIDALLVVAYNASLDGANGGFQLVSAVQPAISPATAAQARTTTLGSVAMTPAVMRNSPVTVGGAITFGSGSTPSVTYSENLRVVKTGVGAFIIAWTSSNPETTAYGVTFGGAQSGFYNWASVGTSGISVNCRDVANAANQDITQLSVFIKAPF